MRPSIKDVALRSGVSYKTVSRVINGDVHVSPATRERVLAAVEALGYRPDHSARSLRRRRTQSLGLLIVPGSSERFLTEPWFDEVVAGVVDRASRAGYSLVLEVIGRGELALRSPSLAERRVDGAILMDGRISSPLLPDLQRVGLPCVRLPGQPGEPALGWIYADFLGGARAVVEHLIALGHRRIAHLTGDTRNRAEADRRAGYERALAEAGLALDPALVVLAGHLRHQGYAAMEALLARGVDFTAVFAVNDLTALGAIECLLQHGLRVPEDLSVAGFDDIYLAPYARPPLTTARLPAYDMGVAATDLAIGAIEGTRTLPDGKCFPVELQVRASTAPPPASPRRRGAGAGARLAARRVSPPPERGMTSEVEA